MIAENGDQLGVCSIEDAKAKAAAVTLDLVEISPNAEPPVVKIMDFGKYRFDQKKKLNDSRKKQKQVKVKEIKFRPGTDIGDYNIKLKNLTRFLENGDRTKVTMRFRGREMAHQEIGLEVLKQVEKDLEEIGVVEQFPKMEGRQMVMVIAPRK